MKVRIDTLPDEGLELDLSAQQDILADALKTIPRSEDVGIDPVVEGHLKFFEVDEEIFVSGHFKGTFHLKCSRCLADFSLQKELDINLAIESRDPGSGITREMDIRSEEVFFINGLEFDPADIIIQELLLELPMKPLCREECPGLCPKCGALRGSEECTCSQETLRDSRWDALARLKERITQ